MMWNKLEWSHLFFLEQYSQFLFIDKILMVSMTLPLLCLGELPWVKFLHNYRTSLECLWNASHLVWDNTLTKALFLIPCYLSRIFTCAHARLVLFLKVFSWLMRLTATLCSLADCIVIFIGYPLILMLNLMVFSDSYCQCCPVSCIGIS